MVLREGGVLREREGVWTQRGEEKCGGGREGESIEVGDNFVVCCERENR